MLRTNDLNLLHKLFGRTIQVWRTIKRHSILIYIIHIPIDAARSAQVTYNQVIHATNNIAKLLSIIVKYNDLKDESQEKLSYTRFNPLHNFAKNLITVEFIKIFMEVFRIKKLCDQIGINLI